MVPTSHKLLISLMLIAALSTAEVRCEVQGIQTGLCGRNEGEADENSCTELAAGVDCYSSVNSEKSTAACDEV